MVDCQGSGGADGAKAERAVDRQRHSSGWAYGCATAAEVVSWTDKGAIIYREGRLLLAVDEASSFPDSSGSRSAGGIVTVNGRNEASGAFFIDALQGGLIVADQEELECGSNSKGPAARASGFPVSLRPGRGAGTPMGARLDQAELVTLSRADLPKMAAAIVTGAALKGRLRTRSTSWSIWSSRI